MEKTAPLLHKLLFPVFEDSLGCLYQNGHCEHFCDGSGARRKCFCADGYQLADDGKKCVPKGEGKVTAPSSLGGCLLTMSLCSVAFPCGRVASPATGPNQTMQDQVRLLGASYCNHGDCPWQVNTAAPHSGAPCRLLLCSGPS